MSTCANHYVPCSIYTVWLKFHCREITLPQGSVRTKSFKYVDNLGTSFGLGEAKQEEVSLEEHRRGLEGRDIR